MKHTCDTIKLQNGKDCFDSDLINVNSQELLLAIIILKMSSVNFIEKIMKQKSEMRIGHYSKTQ